MTLRLSVAENPGSIPKGFMERLMDERVNFEDEFSSRIWGSAGAGFQISNYPVLSDNPRKIEEKTVDIFIDYEESAMAFVLDKKASIQVVEGTEVLRDVLPELLHDRDTRAIYRPIRGGPPKLERIVSKTKGVVFESGPEDRPSGWVDLKKIGIDFEDFQYITHKQPATLKTDMRKYMKRKEIDLQYVDEYLSNSMRGTQREKTEARKRFYSVLVSEIKKMQDIKTPERPQRTTSGTTTSTIGGSVVGERRINFGEPPGKDKQELKGSEVIGFEDFLGITGRAKGTANAALKRSEIDRESIPLGWASDYINNMQRVTDEDRRVAKKRLEQYKSRVGEVVEDRQLADKLSQALPDVNVSGGALVAEPEIAARQATEDQEIVVSEPVGTGPVIDAKEVIAPETTDTDQADSDTSAVEEVAAPVVDLDPESHVEDFDRDIETAHSETVQLPDSGQVEQPKGYTFFEFLNLSGLNSAEAMGVIETDGIIFARGKLEGAGVEKYLERVGKLPLNSVEPEPVAETLAMTGENVTVVGEAAQPEAIVQDDSSHVEELERGADAVLDFISDQTIAGEDLDDNLVAEETGDLDTGKSQEELELDQDIAVEGTQDQSSPARRSEVYRIKKVAGVLGIDAWGVKHLVEIGRLKPVSLEGKYSGITYFAREDVLRLKAEQIQAQIGRKVYTRAQALDTLSGNSGTLYNATSKKKIRTYQDKFFDAEDTDNLARSLELDTSSAAVNEPETPLSQGEEVGVPSGEIEEPVRGAPTQISTTNQLVTDGTEQTLISNFTEIAKRYGVTEDEARDHIRRAGLRRDRGGYRIDLVDTHFARIGIKPVIPIQSSDTDQSLLSASVVEVVQDTKDDHSEITPDTQDPRKYSLHTARKMLGASWDDVHNKLVDAEITIYKGGDVDADQLDSFLERRLSGENLVDKEKAEPPGISKLKADEISKDLLNGSEVAFTDPKPALPSSPISTEDDIKPVRRRYTEMDGSSVLGVTEGVFRQLVQIHGIPLENGSYDADKINRLRDDLAKYNPGRATKTPEPAILSDTETPVLDGHRQQPEVSHIKDIASRYGISRSEADKLLKKGGVRRATVTHYPTKDVDELLSRLGYKHVSEGSDTGPLKETDLETGARKVLESIGSKPDKPVDVTPRTDLYTLGETAEALHMDKTRVMDLVNDHKIKMGIVDGKIFFEKGEIARFGSESGIEIAYVSENVSTPKPEPIISDHGAVVVENQDARVPPAENLNDSVSVEPPAAPSAEELDNGVDEVLEALEADVDHEEREIISDGHRHTNIGSGLVDAWTGERHSCKIYDIEMFYGLTRTEAKEHLKEAGLWTAKPGQTFNRRNVAERFAEIGIAPQPLVRLPVITNREKANLGRLPEAPQIQREQVSDRPTTEETEYRRPDGKPQQPTGQPKPLYRPHDIQRIYGLNVPRAHALLEESRIQPTIIHGNTKLYPVTETNRFFESRGIKPVGDRQAVELPSAKGSSVAESVVGKKIEPLGDRQQGVDKPIEREIQETQPPKSPEVKQADHVAKSPSSFVFGRVVEPYKPSPRPELPDIFKLLRDSILPRLERERRTHFGGDKNDLTSVLRQGGTVVCPDSETEFVKPEYIERVFGHGYERIRAMLAWQGLETDPIKGVNREHMRKFIENDITKLNPEIADRMMEEFGYKQGSVKEAVSVDGGVRESVDVTSDDVKDVTDCVEELTPRISPPVLDDVKPVGEAAVEKADAEKPGTDIVEPQTENTGDNPSVEQDETDLEKVDDKPPQLDHKGKGEENDEEQDDQGDYYSGAFRGSISLEKFRTLIGDKKAAHRIGERYGQDGRIDNATLARLAAGVEYSELGTAQRGRLLMELRLPTDTVKAVDIVGRYCPEIRHVDRRREVIAFNPMADYTIGDLSRMGLKHGELDLIKKGSEGSVPGWRAAEILVRGWQIDTVTLTFGYKGNVGQISEIINKQKADYGRGRRS